MVEVSTPALMAMVAVTIGLIELLKVSIAALTKKNIPQIKPVICPLSPSSLTRIETKLEEVHMQSKELHDMHNKFDADGTPLWYVPRSWSSTQTEILKAVNTISNTQEKLGETISRIAVVLDKIEDKVDKYDD